MKRYLFLLALFISVVPYAADASYMSPISDLIANSQPSTSTPHIISFRVTNAVPAGGTITITPEAGAFSVPVGFDHTDVDFLTSSGGPYVQRDLGSSPGVGVDGVSSVSGFSGSVTITLGTDQLDPGEDVRIYLGTAASYQASGSRSPLNPATTGSYRIRVNTDIGGTAIDVAKAMVVIIQPVRLSADIVAIDPVRFNGLPSGTVAAGSVNIEISLNTDKPSNCRYATSSGVTYGSMTNSMSSVAGMLHYRAISGHQDTTSYTYYVRCTDAVYDIRNTTDYPITFSVGTMPSVTTSDGNTPGSGFATGGSGGSGGSGPFPNGSAVLFKSGVTLTGKAPARTTVTILRDGKQELTTQAAADGSFSGSVTNLERGTYTFVVYATDGQGRRTSNYSSTLTLTSGSVNSISGVLLSPTIGLVSNEVAIGADIEASGIAVPDSLVEISLKSASSSSAAVTPKTFTASSTADGSWSFTIPGDGIARGTYEVRAKSLMQSVSSNVSLAAYVGIGEAPSRTADAGLRADINKDGRVNLVDFSILLTNWGGDDPDSDINEDGSINLADFSILLFNWTG